MLRKQVAPRFRIELDRGTIERGTILQVASLEGSSRRSETATLDEPESLLLL